ncbi:hypothetical protein LTR53_008794 [Teratosphaeriaceae sp. CCFEE 6253]|nr:hypothetical protein LTR53_008794 [Teratosphaeriaceae sp. CCFEE 6253]
MARIDQIDGDHRPRSPDSGNESTPTPASAPFAAQYGLGRHRRLLNTRARAASSSSAFNPQVVELVPTTPTKRKASSTALSGNSTAFGPRSRETVIIKGKDLFGNVDERVTGTHPSGLEDYMGEAELLEFEETFAQQAMIPGSTWQFPAFLLDQPPGHGASSSSQRLTSYAKVDAKTPRLSVMLVSLPSDTAPSNRVRYLPLGKVPQFGRKCNQEAFTVLPAAMNRIQGAEGSVSSTSWPPSEVPTELFAMITQHLARDDIKSMRLVNHEFEAKVSRSLFHTSVVPFNTELYDMVGDEVKNVVQQPQPKPESIDKGKRPAVPRNPTQPRESGNQGGLHWKNAKDDVAGKVYKGHGLRVFQGFGPHIKRFGMSFEVSEDQLLQLPHKKELDRVDTYYGNYDWPPPGYTRFADLAGLERTADETSRMKEAFGKLDIVQELALSVDSGLGWMSGPDVSLRARLFKRPSAVFGRSIDVPDHDMQAAKEFWSALQQSHTSFSHQNLREVSVAYRGLDTTPALLEGLQGTVFADESCWPAIDAHRVLPDGAGSGQSSRLGVLFTTAQPFDTAAFTSDANVTPIDLAKEQKEWLLETEWAQRAFLESYMLAVVDNPATFEGVTRLDIAKLSSGFLPIIARQHFWEALPSLQELTLHVSPHWRAVAKDKAGIAETTAKIPSGAVTFFYSILRTRISMIDTLKKLDIGWTDGGEHAQGMFARNGNVLPAPVTQLDQCIALNIGDAVLTFRHIEELTLTNCWMTPVVLESLVQRNVPMGLRKLTLKSVSMTAHPRFAQPPAQHPAAVPAAAVLGNFNAHNQAPQPMPPHAMAWAGIPAPTPAGFGNPNHQQPWWATAGNAGWIGPINQAPFGLPANPLPAPNVPANQPQPHPHPLPPMDANGHREGSWPHVLARLFPRPIPTPDDSPFPPRPTLQTLDLNSVGYLHLNHTHFDQSSVEHGAHGMSPWFRLRHAALRPMMLDCKERYMGTVVQHLPPRELDALVLLWGLREGWEGEDAWRAEEPEFDGFARGGTGRVSGVVVLPRLDE